MAGRRRQSVYQELVEAAVLIFVAIAFLWGCSQNACYNILLKPVIDSIINVLKSLLVTILYGIAALLVGAVGYKFAEWIKTQYPYDDLKMLAACFGIPLLVVFVLPIFIDLPLLSLAAWIFMAGEIAYFVLGSSSDYGK